MNSINEVKQFYDEATYRKLHGFIYSNTRVEYAWQALKNIFGFRSPKRVLEIGSGIGEICNRIALQYNNADVIGFDISEQSISMASNLFTLPNLSFVRADSISKAKFASSEKFEIIFLMDVYEHIPVEERDELQKFIKENISENGFVFFSCPTVHHQNYLKYKNPADLQPVDEDITLPELIDFSNKTELEIIMFKMVSVWQTSDYLHVIFSNRLASQPFSDFKNTSEPVALKKEIAKRIKKKLTGKKNEDSIQYRRELIRSKLGKEILKKVEEYRK